MQYQPQRAMKEEQQNDSTSTSSSAGSSSVRNVRARKSASAFRTISEVADQLDVQQHVLRFWETKFSQVRPLKRGGGRRYYRPEDVELLQTIHHLLYVEGYTIKGVQKLLKEQGKNAVVENTQISIANDVPAAPSQQLAVDAKEAVSRRMSQTQRRALEVMLAELKELRALIKA